ncbi:MAG: FAD:protein FMN transferase [Eggerthellales bacterium]|nr:FAD:protein FMN transferase [Eggerthellales bacterium]
MTDILALMNTHSTSHAPVRLDVIPLQEEFTFSADPQRRLATASFFAFNTVISLMAPYADAPGDHADAPGDHAAGPSAAAAPDAHTADPSASANPAIIRRAFEEARDACRHFERAFSRTLPHSDISTINRNAGTEVEVCLDTYRLLEESLRYCRGSQGRFDITMGAVTRLWDFHAGTVPDKEQVHAALSHVNWENVKLRRLEDGRCMAKLADPQAFLDVGGTAKGYIADALSDGLLAAGIGSFVVNLGGNVVAHGCNPMGNPWSVGIRDPRYAQDGPNAVVGSVSVSAGSVVTSGVYERQFIRDGVRYHHILDPSTGFPVETDVAGVSVVACKSMDAEGFSTTLLALGLKAGLDFARQEGSILAAYFVDDAGRVHGVQRFR